MTLSLENAALIERTPVKDVGMKTVVVTFHRIEEERLNRLLDAAREEGQARAVTIATHAADDVKEIIEQVLRNHAGSDTTIYTYANRALGGLRLLGAKS